MSEFFQLGEEASRGKLVTQLETIRAQGETALSQIERKRLETLVTFERRLSAMNGRRHRANRVLAARTAARFVVSDFLTVDQALTTATVRADAQAVTLRERQTPSAATVARKRFSVSHGTAELMDTNNSLYRVYTDDGTTPSGTFELELVEPLPLALLVFDLAAMPSEPSISVEVSSTGTTYVPATGTSLNGYRLNAWLPSMTVRFIRVRLTPSHPDTLGGRTYTFGLMAFSGSATEFHLLSELVTRPIAFHPNTTKVRLNAEPTPGLTYFLAFGEGGFVEVRPGQVVEVPGMQAVTAHNVDLATPLTGLLVHAFPDDAHLETLRCTQDGSSDVIRIAPGMQHDPERDAHLVHKYLGTSAVAEGRQLFFIHNVLSENAGETFTLRYVTGPAQVMVRLKVQLQTSDRTSTPVFRGAVLEEI